MTLSAEPIIYALIFVGVLVLVEGIYLTVFGRSISLNNRVNRRLEMLDKSGNREEVMEKLRKEMQQHLKARKLPLYSILSDKAQKAAIAFTPRQLIMLMGGLSVLAFIGLSVGTDTAAPVRAIASVGIGVGEFGIIADEAAYGRDMGEALKEMAERLDMQDLRFLAVAVTIQQQSGGNLAEILAGLAKVIRARFRLFRRVKAITAEAKWSGKFLSGFPILALIGIQLIKPDYYDEAMEHPFFIPAVLVVGVFLVMNLIVMRALVNIKV